MSFLKLLVFLFIPMTVSAVDLESIRVSFHRAVMDDSKIVDFHTLALKQDTVDATLIAYLATAEALRAKLIWDPFKKMTQVSRFESLMNAAILKNPSSIEIRFLRLSVEYHIPKILNSSKHIHEDTMYIAEHLNEVSGLNFDRSFGRFIINFMQDTRLLTMEHINILRKQMESLAQN